MTRGKLDGKETACLCHFLGINLKWAYIRHQGRHSGRHWADVGDLLPHQVLDIIPHEDVVDPAQVEETAQQRTDSKVRCTHAQGNDGRKHCRDAKQS